jgi:hypothetical protein
MDSQDPLFIRPVVGYRTWRIKDNKLLPLTSRDLAWSPGVNTASCNAGFTGRKNFAHSAPDPNCGCGLYGFWNLLRLKSLAVRGGIVGVVQMWGDLQVHREGARSQNARIIALSLPRPAWVVREAISMLFLSLFFSLITGQKIYQYGLGFSTGLTLSISLFFALWVGKVIGRHLQARRNIQAVAQFYQAPVVDINELEAIALDYGDPLPTLVQAAPRWQRFLLKITGD